MNMRQFARCFAQGLPVAGLLMVGAVLAIDLPVRTLELPPGEGNPRNSEGGFVALKDGRILFVYSHYTAGSGGDHDSAHLVGRTSSDGGKTWSTEDRLIVANEGGMNMMSVSLLRLQSGEIALDAVIGDMTVSDLNGYFKD